MATAAWYHRDISRVLAEDLLARAGRDGSFLVRDSESVPGAYALCLLFQCHVHTYRILPDADGLLAVQTSQGVQVNCFRTLADLVLGYQQPHKGLVIPLLYPVGRETEPADESSDGDEEKTAGWSSGGALAVPVPQAGHVAAHHVGPQHQLLQRLQDMTTPTLASEAAGLLTEYLYGDVNQDLESLRRGAGSLSHLQHMLSTVCQGLHSEIDLTLSSLETLAKVFDHPSCPLSGPRTQKMARTSEDSLDSLLYKISALCNLLSSLEKRVLNALQEAVTNHSLAGQSALHSDPTSTVKNRGSSIPVNRFQVKLVRYGRQVVSVDVDTGVLLFDRKPGFLGMETISHDRILQVVKFQSSPAKVRMLVENLHNPPHELLFESPRKCEAFCHLLQLMKSRHSKQQEPDVISVFVGTWNMGGSPPPRNLQSWMTCCGLGRTLDESVAAVPHDVYALGTQEHAQGEKEWSEQIRATLKSVTNIDFKQVAVQSLWNIRLLVFVKPEYGSRISHVSTASVKTGLGNTLGSKGAVGISFFLGESSLGFVNCHLTSGSEKVLRRNQNILDVLRLLSLGDKQLGTFDISLRFTHLFWCGDLNYRLDLDVQDILKHVSKREFDELMCSDQLTRERHKRKAFFNFKEERITFPPTYQYERGSRDCYLWQKYKTSGVRINVPSWCDRVLWRSYPETHIMCTSYGCTDDIFTSDHSPVFATFQVGVTPQFFKRERSLEKAWIELERFEAIVKTASKAKFFIEFHSYCLEEVRRTSENDLQSCDVPGFLKLGWSSKHLPKLQPIISDLEFLKDQHLLLSVKSSDGFESYGECCLALRSLITTAAQPFETFLTHRGEEMGSIRGWVKVHVPPDRRQTRVRSYEWLSCQKDEKSLAKSHLPEKPTCVTPSRVPMVPKTSVPNSYTNPAYFMFEGVPVLRQIQEDHKTSMDSQVLLSRDSVLPLPRLSGGRSEERKCPRRSDFTEIEIPGCLPPYVPDCDHQSQALTCTSYQLFPAPKSPHSVYSSGGISPSKEQHLPSHSVRTNTESLLPVKILRNMYMNHSAIPGGIQRPQREHIKKEHSRVTPSGPSLYAYMSTRVPQSHTSASGIGEHPQPSISTGDHSLTALQIAKSLSEVDFLPMGCTSRHLLIQSMTQKKDRGSALATKGVYYTNRQRSFHGAPGTVRELLSNLGLQRYTLGLSLNGWDDLDYFSGITEEELNAAGVSNPFHRRRILENLPKIWD
ncbi:inositol polyphosphate phosphatase-like 1b isoform X2 [Denticeps clupeoides]|uniref:inositol polyphosphate phosphatase-like 1b isoform X2 n=1 Tax=Denticeps clupeoides TaxID=299321 RepID=UPI0010A501E4|nr:phosphatidylinositol 3,4,5-trisphosphate 5-phosphatase 2B-like isoform X2 [Denticeps clupeoides]